MNHIWKWLAVTVGAAYIVSSALTHRLAILRAILGDDAWPTGRADEVSPAATETPASSAGMRAAG